MESVITHTTAIGGGNGLGVVAEALSLPRTSGERITFIPPSFDDGYTSTGVLGRGYYGDVVRVLDGLRVARWGSADPWGYQSIWGQGDWFSASLKKRYCDGVPSNVPFGKLFAELFKLEFTHENDQEVISTILKMLHVEEYRLTVELRVLLREAFSYRLEGWQITNFFAHSFRNLLFYVLEEVAKQFGFDLDRALTLMHILHGIPPEYRVVLLTRRRSTLYGKTFSEKEIAGQCWIDYSFQHPNLDPFNSLDRFKELKLVPHVRALEEPLRAVRNATRIVLACGSLAGNFGAQFCAGGMKEALSQAVQRGQKRQNPLPIILVMNVRTKLGETRFERALTGAEIFEIIRDMIGQSPNCVICDNTLLDPADCSSLPEARIEMGDLRKHQPQGQLPWPFIVEKNVSRVVRDPKTRSAIDVVHDAVKLSQVFVDTFSATTIPARRLA